MRKSMTLLTQLAGLLGVLGVQPALAQSGTENKLMVHGYLTQGVAKSEDLPVTGIPVGTTTDYRSVALQLRYNLTPESRFVLQASHRRLGMSALMTIEPEVEVDWAFFQHRVHGFTARAGRFPLPHGIYNEMRDVGTVLPFFRAPYSIYPDGTETVDGLGLSHTLQVGAWGLESSVSWGGIEYKRVDVGPTSTRIQEERNERAHGAQLWLNTPVEGLRAGVAGLRWFEDDDPEGLWQVSLDADFDRVMLRAEYKNVEAEPVVVSTYYVHGRVKLTEKIHLLGQYESSDVDLGKIRPGLVVEDVRDKGLGLNYVVSPNLVLKLEGHQRRGFDYDTYVNPGAPASNRYGIASISVSF